MNFLTAIIPLLTGITQPIKDWFQYKQDLAKADQAYKLAILNAQAEQAKQELISNTSDLQNRLGATSQEFKQGTFYPLWGVILFSVCFPKQAEVMWQNFSLIPEWFQWLFLSVYSSIWGLPIIKGGYGAITDLLQQRREYKAQITSIKYGINEDKLAQALRKKLFPSGMNQQQWEAIRDSAKESLE